MRAKKFKARRSLLKDLRKNTDRSAAVREGTTYSSGCGHQEISAEELTEIPPLHTPATVTSPVLHKPSTVYFDVETTGLAPTSEITQLAVIGPAGETFQVYVIPDGNIQATASEITGLSVRRRGGVRVLFHNETNVPDAVSEDEALQNFTVWLSGLAKEKLVLVAHNGNTFDNRILLNAANRHGKVDQLGDAVSGFADSLLACREKFSDGQQCSLTGLAARVGLRFEAHNAIEDVRILKLLCEKYVKLSSKHSKSFEDVRETNIHQLRSAQLLATYATVIQQKIITKTMASKAAKSGLACMGAFAAVISTSWKRRFGESPHGEN